MTQRQQYAVVPKPLLEKLIYAVEQESMAYADPIAHVDEAAAALKAWQDAPPPPDQVLDDKKIQSLWCQVANHYAQLSDVLAFAHAIERAVLKQLGAKNV